MPANLSPEYLAAEKRLRSARTDEERLACLEEMLSTIPKHKGTEKMQADIKRRISKLREREEQQRGKRTGRRHSLRALLREGAGAVALVGPPNVGKSSLVCALTDARPEVAVYPFTTLEPQPAVMQFEKARIELVDLPPVCPEHTESWVYDLIKSCDACMVVVDLADADPLEQLQTTRALLERNRILLLPPGQPRTSDGRTVYLPALIVCNKIDRDGAADALELFEELRNPDLPSLAVSAEGRQQLEQLAHRTFALLDLIRVYSKAPGKPADMENPYLLHRGATLYDVAVAVHRELAEQLRFGRIWGANVHDGQVVGRDHVVSDGDVVEIHT